MKHLKKLIILSLSISLVYCNHGKKTNKIVLNSKSETTYFLEDLFYDCDKIIRRADTLIVINSKLDTTVIETGIFSYLSYKYPMTTPAELVNICKSATKYDMEGQVSKAKIKFNEAIVFYNNDRQKWLNSFMDHEGHDLNIYFTYEVNSAILSSYAYEKLNKPDKAIEVLTPFMANVEAWNSRIHERYIKLCIMKYGIDRVREELNNCGKTIKLKKQDASEIDDWVVKVFGADIGVGKAWLKDNITIAEANSLVRHMDFYELIK